MIKEKIEFIGTWIYNHFYFVALVIAAIALVAAYISEFFFGLLPCQLCIYQRIPYYGLIFLKFLSMLSHSKWPFIYRYYTMLATGLIFSTFLLALFSLAVKSRWIAYKSQCISDFSGVESIDDLKTMLETAEVVPCDADFGNFLGLSMPSWHVIYSLLACCLCVMIFRRN